MRDGGLTLHLVVEADELPLDWLTEAWLTITGTAWQVSASVIPQDMSSRREAVFYGSKLAYKSFAEDKIAMAEYLRAVKGKRKAQPFGKWYGKLSLGRRRRHSPQEEPSVATVSDGPLSTREEG